MAKRNCHTVTDMSGAEQNLTQFLLAAATHFAARPALQAFGRTSLSYSQLGRLLNQVTATFREFGIGPADTVAIVLPNGPEMATAFLTTASACCSAPLNPAYKAEELDFYLSDLNASALIVAEHDDGAAVVVARQRSIPVLRLCTDAHQPAGYFTLRLDNKVPCPSPSFNSVPAALTNTALVLHTSGTTSRPKLVPLSQGNLVASARHIAETLRLSPDDHCLNLMPLFHIHGLVGVLLSSLSAGASVTCSPGFLAPKVLGWLAASQATWYSAVPTMHQAIVARTRQETIPSHSLRFIRSSSAALPPQVMQQLEEAFGVPVVESYGMTEAAHQMASNPLPPSVRKPGSVGPAAGPRIAVMDAAGNVLPQGDTGEVVIQGPNVTTGYVANPKANAAAFQDGWFRTGDQGYLDEDGYLFLTGRLKELINRGGEKISPREIDEALLAHPAVAQAVAFAMPDDKLGEEVAAAVVLHEGKTADEPALQDFAAARLADFKVPRRIVLLNDIPKGPTGKLQRINLAEKLGLGTSAAAAVAKSQGTSTDRDR
jgi:oxalate---CoA ligase